MKELELKYYFENMNEFAFKEVFEGCIYPWEALNNTKEFINKFMNNEEMKINKAAEVGEFCSITGNYFIDEGTKIDTGSDFFGGIIGDNSRLGANVATLPGAFIGPYTWILPGLQIRGFVPAQKRVFPKTEYTMTDNEKVELK